MAREQFIDSLRHASRMLTAPDPSRQREVPTDASPVSRIISANLWLTPRSVEGFDPADWPPREREELTREVAAFRVIAEGVSPDKPPTRAQSKQARKHLERVIDIVGSQVLHDWLGAQKEMMEEARAAAEARGWYVQMDEKEVLESLLGSYKAPRLRIRADDKEVVLDPVARFGSGHQGVVDLVVLPTYETAYLVAFKDGRWQIVSPHGTAHRRPFTQATLVNTITTLCRH